MDVDPDYISSYGIYYSIIFCHSIDFEFLFIINRVVQPQTARLFGFVYLPGCDALYLAIGKALHSQIPPIQMEIMKH